MRLCLINTSRALCQISRLSPPLGAPDKEWWVWQFSFNAWWTPEGHLDGNVFIFHHFWIITKNIFISLFTCLEFYVQKDVGVANLCIHLCTCCYTLVSLIVNTGNSVNIYVWMEGKARRGRWFVCVITFSKLSLERDTCWLKTLTHLFVYRHFKLAGIHKDVRQLH